MGRVVGLAVNRIGFSGTSLFAEGAAVGFKLWLWMET